MKLYMTAIHDKVSDNLFGFVNSTDVQGGASFIVNCFADLTEIEKVPAGDYEVVSIGYLDVQKKEFVNDYQVVCQLGVIEKKEEAVPDEI